MTTYTAPPDETDLILNRGDILNVNEGGAATGTTINLGGVEIVHKGTDTGTTINTLGRENVEGGTSTDAAINRGGRLDVEHQGIANGTIIHGGTEFIIGLGSVSNGTIIDGGHELVTRGAASNGTIIDRFGVEILDDGGNSNGTIVNRGGEETVERSGTANGTTIAQSGVEHVNPGGTANNVIFGGPDAVLQLGQPSGLKGSVSDWQVGDVIDFKNTSVTSAQEDDAHSTLTVHYAAGNLVQTATYTLVNQQADTAFELRSDRHGGTELILTPIVGVDHHEAAIHFGPGPHFSF